MPVSAMSPVEAPCITGQKPAHDRCDGNASGAKKQMDVFAHQSPCLAGRNLPLQKPGQPLKKIFPVFVILENPFPFDSSDDNVMQGAGGVYAGLAGVAVQIPGSRSLLNKETTSPFSHTRNAQHWWEKRRGWPRRSSLMSGSGRPGRLLNHNA